MSGPDAMTVVRKLRHRERLTNEEARAVEDLLHTVVALAEQCPEDTSAASNWRVTRRRFLEYFTAPADDKP